MVRNIFNQDGVFMRVFIIEQDAFFGQLLSTPFLEKGWKVYRGRDISDFDIAGIKTPDVVLMSFSGGADHLPNIDAFRRSSLAPLLVLAGSAHPRDAARALDTGADQYIPLPSHIDYIVSCAQVLHRGVRREMTDVAWLNERTKIDYKMKRVTVDDQELRFTQYQYSVVEWLSRNRGRKVTTQECREAAGWDSNSNVVEAQMTRIRKVFDDALGAGAGRALIKNMRSSYRADQEGGYMMLCHPGPSHAVSARPDSLLRAMETLSAHP
jgi:DNA-binding response OmpR family regulator